MPQTSLLGAGAPKQRTINVEVNLLAEWLESRSRLREERLRWTGTLVTACLFSLILLPYLSNLAAGQQARAHRASRLVDARLDQLNRLSSRMNVVQPQIDGEAALDQCRSRSRVFMGQVLAVLNSSTNNMAVDSIEASVLAGDMTLRAKALSTDYNAAQDFVARAGRGSHVRAAILVSTRQSSLLGGEGVAFEFAKKVGVAP